MLFGWKPSLQKSAAWADLVLKCTSTVAILAAGLWTLTTFVWLRSDVENLNLSVSTQQVPTGGDRKLLVIHARPKNLGKILGKPSVYSIAIRELPRDSRPGSAIEYRSIKPLLSFDVLRNYKGGYEIEPGVEYDDVEMIVLRKGSLVVVSAELGFNDGSSVDVHEILLVE